MLQIKPYSVNRYPYFTGKPSEGPTLIRFSKLPVPARDTINEINNWIINKEFRVKVYSLGNNEFFSTIEDGIGNKMTMVSPKKADDKLNLTGYSETIEQSVNELKEVFLTGVRKRYGLRVLDTKK